MNLQERQRPLRVRFVVAARVTPAWIAMLLDEVAANPALDLVEVQVSGRGERDADGAGKVVLPIVMRADVWLFGGRVRYLAPVDLATWSDEWKCRCADGSDAASAIATTPTPVTDLSVDLTGKVSGDAQYHSAKEWRLAGVPTTLAGLDAELPMLEVAAISRVRLILFELTERLQGRREWCVIHQCRCPAHSSSGLMTGERLAASAFQLLQERLVSEAASVRGSRGDVDASRAESRKCIPEGGVGGGSALQGATQPGVALTVRFGLNTVVNRARDAIQEKRWELLIGRLPSETLLPEPRSLARLAPPKGRYWADPFVVAHDGRTHVFFEEFVYETRRGHISVVTLGERAEHSPVSIALETESHLSYPCVFQYDGRFFMVPENAASGGLDLYECVDVPCRWEHRRRLSDAPLVDATVFPWDGLWWMFASLQKPSSLPTAELLLLYVTDDPVGGTWRRHPSAPLLADATRARPAGVPFAVEGRLFRLGQDGSRGYGWGMSLSEVTSLTPEAYSEVAVTTIRPDWEEDICGTHTLNRAGDVVVMDVCRRVLRNPRRAPAQNMSN